MTYPRPQSELSRWTATMAEEHRKFGNFPKIVLPTRESGNKPPPHPKGALAQLVEHLHGMQGVSGSNPLRSTTLDFKSDENLAGQISPEVTSCFISGAFKSVGIATASTTTGMGNDLRRNITATRCGLNHGGPFSPAK
jgi:hypothetical protein